MTPSEPGKMGFALKDYAATLHAYLDAGYAVTSFEKYLDDPQPKHLVLRHDIDNSIEQAMRVARVDAEAGCTSSIFLRVHARGYSIMSLPSLMMIREMEELGHEVQLHLEGGIGEVMGGTNLEWAEKQRTVFETAVGRPLGGFSLHEPARLGGFEFASELLERWSDTVRYHSYEPRFMMPSMKYLSDSSGHWREGHFALWVDREPLIQVLTHPFWWFEKVPAENY
ncbi:GCN5 family acetyltransferase [Microbacterium sp. NPDC089696]|uniref:GCN5 family acetyltransferase n=1 Tax=Microbacterium sp. NPDC089696 TaxID=3364199 RepID=UPI0038074997